MHGPLWSFYQFYRQQSSAAPAIDQYYYLLEALHELPLAQSIRTVEELRSFCKLFWLRPGTDEKQFDAWFEQHFQWAEWEKQWQSKHWQPTEKTSEATAGTSVPSSTNNQDAVTDTTTPGPAPEIDEGGEPILDLPPPPPDNIYQQDMEQMVDFELIISDSQGKAQVEKTEIRYEHDFILEDQALMPFNLRHFAQRLRRRIETPVYEYTNRLDILAMIEQYCRQGFIEELIYQRRNASNSNIVLLADRHGSMHAYEYWEHQLELAFHAIPSCRFEHYQFFTLPKRDQSQQHYELKYARDKRRNFNTARHQWTKNTWFFIFSDAGGHSGVVDRDRLRNSLKFWYYLKDISKQVYWLNPMPYEFQNDCTAKRLQFSIPMTYPDQTGLDDITNRKANV